MRVGFIGLGIMGRAMARNLVRGGFRPLVWARRAESMAPLLADGCDRALSPADLARRCEVVFSCVSDGPDVEAVTLGQGGIAESARPGLVYVDLSTISPQLARSLAARLAEHGVSMLDAPVSGGEAGAVAGTLTIMVGGDAAIYERVFPALRCMGSTVTWVGPAGAGQVAKACNQIVTGTGIHALAEAFSFARRFGADPVRVREALLGGFAASRILDLHGGRMLARDFAPGFRAWMHQKDMAIVLAEAASLGLALPLAASAAQLFNLMIGLGMAEEDSIAVLKLHERLSAPASAPDAHAGAGASMAKSTHTMRAGFVGLGAMGRPMALNLLRAGVPVAVYARRPEAVVPLAAAGATVFNSVAEMAAQVDVVFTVVTSSADVEAVLCGPAGVCAGARRGTLVVDHSTIAPQVARRLGCALHERGLGFLDAPVSGGEQGAIAGTLAIMAGGDRAVFEAVHPLLAVLGKTIVHIGPGGAGQVAKACNQMIMVAAIQACAEAMLLARASGVDPARVKTALMGGAAASRVLEVMGERMVRRDFAAGIEARLHHKDFGLIRDEAHSAGVWLPMAGVVAQQLNALMGQGWGKDDTSSLLRVLEIGSGSRAG